MATVFKRYPCRVDKATPAGFPIALHGDQISVSHSFWDDLQSDGGNIRIFTDGELKTEIPFQLKVITVGSEIIAAWIRLPSAMSINDEYWIGLITGGGVTAHAVDDPFGSEAVWQDYNGVYQGDAPDVNQTGGTADGNITGGEVMSGASLLNDWPAMAFGLEEGVDDDDIVVNPMFTYTEICHETVVVWKNGTTEAATDGFIIEYDNSNNLIRKSDVDEFSFFRPQSGGGGAQMFISTQDEMSDDAWHVLNCGRPAMGVAAPLGLHNGNTLTSPTATSGGSAPATPTGDFGICNAVLLDRQFGGRFTEFRFLPSTVKDDTWRGLESDCFNVPADLATMQALDGIIAVVGQAVETDTALPVAVERRIAIGIATETNTALPVTIRKDVAIGQAAETDTALPVTLHKNIPIGIATETDTAFAVSCHKDIDIGIASETDTAFAVTRRKDVAIGQAIETDTALPVTLHKNIPIGIASETDTAFALALRKNIAIGIATETDTAFAVAVGGTINVNIGIATETDTALPVTLHKNIPIGQAVETDTALPVTIHKMLAIGVAIETDTALAVTIDKNIGVGQASETDTALAVTPQSHLSIGIASETDTAFALSIQKRVGIGIATETDTAFAVGVNAEFVASTSRLITIGAIARTIDVAASPRTLTL